MMALINHYRLLLTLLLLLSITPIVLADLKITTKNSFGESGGAQSTTYIKGARQRTEQSMGGMGSMVSIYQCDLKRSIQLNDRTRKYLINLLDAGSSPSSSSREDRADQTDKQVKTRKGGIVTFTVSINDTGERKQMFGFTARRIKTSMVTTSSPDACNRSNMKMETDGWYIDLDYGFQCTTADRPVPSTSMPHKPECIDEMRFKTTGGGKLGYPLSVTTIMYGENGSKSMTMTQETVEISRDPLNAALFDIPDGYTEAKDYQELAGLGVGSIDTMIGNVINGEPEINSSDNQVSPSSNRTKTAGTIRVGVVAFNNPTGQVVSLDPLRQKLIGELNGSNIDAVPLDGIGSANVEAEAKQKDCDYILYTDITNIKQASAGKKMGGLFGKATGIGSMGLGKSEVKIDFRLLPIGSSNPQLQSSATAKEEGLEASLADALDKEAKMVQESIRSAR
jgi:hypothetical protein